MYHRELSEQAIISGFRKGDANIIREYFYGYCQAGYYIARCAEMVQERVWQHHL